MTLWTAWLESVPPASLMRKKIGPLPVFLAVLYVVLLPVRLTSKRCSRNCMASIVLTMLSGHVEVQLTATLLFEQLSLESTLCVVFSFGAPAIVLKRTLSTRGSDIRLGRIVVKSSARKSFVRTTLTARRPSAWLPRAWNEPKKDGLIRRLTKKMKSMRLKLWTKVSIVGLIWVLSVDVIRFAKRINAILSDMFWTWTCLSVTLVVTISEQTKVVRVGDRALAKSVAS